MAMNKHPTVVMTGATNGFGLEAAKELARQGVRLVLMARSARKGQLTLGRIRAHYPEASVEIVEGDMSSLQSVRDFAAQVKASHPIIDVLINNAGVVLDEKQTSVDGFDLGFATNYLGAVVLTLDLLEPLQAAAHGRIIETCSIGEWLGTLQLNELASTSSYPATKRALLMFTCALARRLADAKPAALAFHPGVCPPEIPGKPSLARRLLYATIATHADVVGKSLADLATNPRYAGLNGAYLTVGGRRAHGSWASQNLEMQEKLWIETAKLLKKHDIQLPLLCS
jgi:NAD(P)-dependent dehydrogenase (short-subunit alcohol dehydrogenase family)